MLSRIPPRVPVDYDRIEITHHVIPRTLSVVDGRIHATVNTLMIFFERDHLIAAKLEQAKRPL